MKRNFQQEIATPKVCKSFSKQRPYLMGLITIMIFLSFVILTVNMAFIFSSMPNIGATVKNSLIYGVILICVTAFACIVIFGFRKFILSVSMICLWIASITAIAATNNIWVIPFGVLIIAAIIFFAWLYHKRKLNPKIISTRTITLLAMFVALSIVFKMISNTISNMLVIPELKLSISYIPWVISGLSLGPVGGFIVGSVGDILGQLIVPHGGFPHPLLTLSNGLFGVFPAVFYQYVKIRSSGGKTFEIPKIIIGMIVSSLVCTFGISSIVLWKMYAPDTNFFMYLLIKRTPQLVSIAINAAIIIWLLKPLKKINIISPNRLY